MGEDSISHKGTKARSDDGSTVSSRDDLARWLKAEAHVMPRAKRVAFARFVDGLNTPQGNLPLSFGDFGPLGETPLPSPLRGSSLSPEGARVK